MNKPTEIYLENIMHNITYIRKTLGISKKKMAEILGLGVGSLEKIEKGILPPKLSVEILFNIRENFCHRLDDFYENKFGGM